MNAGFVGKGLLAKRLGLAQAPYIGREAMLDVHAATQTPLQPINLQTMSDIGRLTISSERLPIASLIVKVGQMRLSLECGYQHCTRNKTVSLDSPDSLLLTTNIGKADKCLLRDIDQL